MSPLDSAAAARLATWLSPAFPVGAYTYSHGVEWAVEAGDVVDRAGLIAWVSALLRWGSGRADAILFAHAHRAAGDPAALRDLDALALALAPSRERRLETGQQGAAFRRAVLAVWPEAGAALAALNPADCAYPVAVGAAAAAAGLALEPALAVYLRAFVGNLISAAVRLIPLGQTDGLKAGAALEPLEAEIRAIALTAGLDDLGGACFAADLASLHHETQWTRLFRS